MSPRKYPRHSPDLTTDDLDLLTAKLDEQQNVYLAWFIYNSRRFLYKPEELSPNFEMILISKKSDGALYEIKKKPAGSDR